jgi:predicted AlkP superfamily pyrophosphatase or phosphodiesterase
MVRKLVFSIAFLFAALFSFSQTKKPKLIVGLVIDQMRWDYLYRYNDLYGAGGFKRLLKDGFTAENTFIPYMPTYTAPGHSSIYTGSVPAINGIAGNNWWAIWEGQAR